MSRSTGERSGRRVAAVLLLASVSIGVSSSMILAADEPTISGAALTSGLQTAVRISPPTTTVPAGPVLPPQVQAVVDITNAERAKYGIPPLTYHVQLEAAANAHGADQRNNRCATGYLTHTGSDGSNAGMRIRGTGLVVSNWGENIACGYPSAGAVMGGWISSPGHRANLLNSSFTHVGVSLMYSDSGLAYWVQVFGTPRT